MLAKSTDKVVWPEKLTLRDSGVIADEGQRIFTTATGYGYEKHEYIRADIVAEQLADLKAELSWAHETICY